MHKKHRQRIGIVGGMGNEAMVDLIEKMARIQGSPSCEFIAFGNSKLAYKPRELTQTCLPTDGPELRKMDTALFTLKFMQALKVDVLGLACNSGHALFRKILPELEINFVDMIHETAHLLEGTKDNVLVMGVDSLVHSGLYQSALNEQGISSTIPNTANQTKVMAAIYDADFGIKTAQITREAERLLCDVIREEYEAQGCSKIALGCTELPLALTAQACERFKKEGLIPEHIEVVDASNILAKALLSAKEKRKSFELKLEECEPELHQGPHTDWFAPLCFKVPTLQDMARIQKEVFRCSVDFLRAKNKTITGSYLHLPTLFISDTIIDGQKSLEKMGIAVHTEDDEMEGKIMAELASFHAQMQD